MLSKSDKNKIVKWFSCTFPKYNFHWDIYTNELFYICKEKWVMKFIWFSLSVNDYKSFKIDDCDTIETVFKKFGGFYFINKDFKGVSFPKDYLEMEMEILSNAK